VKQSAANYFSPSETSSWTWGVNLSKLWLHVMGHVKRATDIKFHNGFSLHIYLELPELSWRCNKKKWNYIFILTLVTCCLLNNIFLVTRPDLYNFCNFRRFLSKWEKIPFSFQPQHFAPRVKIWPRGVNLAPRGELCSLGVNLSRGWRPSVRPFVLLKRRVSSKFTPGANYCC
jgi:hypothetical protein